MALHDRIVLHAGAIGIRTELNAAEVFADCAGGLRQRLLRRKVSCLPKRNCARRAFPRECTGSSSLMVRELLSHLLSSLTRLRAKQIISDLPLAEFSWASWGATRRRVSFARRMR